MCIYGGWPVEEPFHVILALFLSSSAFEVHFGLTWYQKTTWERTQ